VEDVLCPSVLLVGRNGSWGDLLLRTLEKVRSKLSFSSPQAATPEYARKGAYRLILLDSTVCPEQRKQITAGLIGSNASIFYTFPVEHGLWWLPTLRRGQDCLGDPAYRWNEFPSVLEQIFQEQTGSQS
jgi:hypothetical protein